MNNTGVVRKIDELGRIVIPKEIRKVLNINANDDLEIKIENKNIILKKYSYMGDRVYVYNKILDKFDDIFNGQIFVTDKEKIVTPGLLFDCKLNDLCVTLLNERKNYKSQAYETIEFDNQKLEGYFFINSIIIDSDSIGLIIYNSAQPIAAEDEKYMLVLASILS